ncbi:LuxR C-terminal-related transcriptional regulator [Streptomyces griseoflavus]|uniref:LuxR C-terminal-related transcriptional regulator n=1 Tax=Streptomyces griseoflavus TaxID=35619 RepID=UPI00167D40A9|nr:response regulator transcription factor [Streptomyces griseoflavus]GGV46623.1 DNA-binding response regulator [Streptomyces griseoflavus]
MRYAAQPAVRLMIADAQEMSRHGLRSMLADDPGVEVVGEAAGAADALYEARSLRPDIMIVDHDLPSAGGLDLARRLNDGEIGHVVRTVVLSSTYSDEALSTAVRLQVGGYLDKSCPALELTAAVHAVAEGAAFLSAQVTRQLFERFELLPSHPALDEAEQVMGLSQREVDVVRSIGGALSNREIAKELGVSETTVKSHVSRLLTKLDLRDRVQVALLAVRLGLVPLHATPSDAGPANVLATT